MEKARSWNIDQDAINDGKKKLLSFYEKINKCGYFKITNLINSNDIKKFKKEVIRLHDEEKENKGLHHSRPPHQVANNLPSRTRVFDNLIESPKIIEVIDHYFGNGANLLEFRAINLLQCNEMPFMHKDSMTNTMPGSPLRIFFIIALDPFKDDNGATFVIPGSHHFPFGPDPLIAKYMSKKSINLNPGEGLVFDANLWHGPSANFSGNSRWGLSLAYGHWFIKSQFNWIKSINEEEFNSISDETKRLLGYNSRPPVNHLERMNTVLNKKDIKFKN